MDRRQLLKGFGLLVGGLALKEAIPFGRVWSFPKEIKIAPRIVTPTIGQYADYVCFADVAILEADPMVAKVAAELAFREGKTIEAYMRQTGAHMEQVFGSVLKCAYPWRRKDLWRGLHEEES